MLNCVFTLHGHGVHQPKLWKQQHNDIHLEDNLINFGQLMVWCAAEMSAEAHQQRPAGEGEAEGQAVY